MTLEEKVGQMNQLVGIEYMKAQLPVQPEQNPDTEAGRAAYLDADLGTRNDSNHLLYSLL